MSVLPQGTEIPATGGKYLNKFPEGQTRFRILETPILPLIEAWKTEAGGNGSYVRVGITSEVPMKEATNKLKLIGYDEFSKFKDKITGKPQKQKVKYLWAVKAWIYNDPINLEEGGELKILTITQKNLMNQIESDTLTNDWKDHTTFDCIVTRKGLDLTSEYAITNCIPKPLDEEALTEFTENPISWEKYIANEDPFDTEATANDAKEIFSGDAPPPEDSHVSE